jgi:LmbE family N-acetylglucosaminyl deacetylase
MNFVRSILAATIIAAALHGPSDRAAAQQPTPQYRVQPISDLTGAPGLALALRRLTTVGTLMHATAHPDDEPNGILALYARHLGMRVALVTATRGDGGQNEIGSELFDALGILRTEELLIAHRFDGAEQYFARAVDFGYSFSKEETFEKWGHQEILSDYVRHIRTLRPDVLVTMSPDGAGGGQHHQASAVLAAEAFRAAADPAKFPEQIGEGLRPWQVRKLYRPLGGIGGRGGRGGPPAPGGRAGGRGPSTPSAAPTDATVATLDTNIFEPWLGCTIGEIGSIASGMHMCQGRVPMVPSPSAPGGGRYRLVESVPPKAVAPETSLFDGLDTSLSSLARFAGDRPPQPLITALAGISGRVEAASRALESRGPAATLPDLVSALSATRRLLDDLGSMGLSDEAIYEVDLRLRLKEVQLQDAIVLAQGIRIDAVANDGLIVAGQALGINVDLANRASGDVAVHSVVVSGFDGAPACPKGVASVGTPYSCPIEVSTPRNARLTNVYWQRPENAGRATFDADAPFGLPFRPSPFRARLDIEVAGARLQRDVPIQFRYEGAGLVGEKRMELHVVPAFAVSVSPRVVVVPARAVNMRPSTSSAPSAASREIRVTVVNGTKRAATATVRLKTPAGWRVTPPSASIAFSREDESTTTKFAVVPPAPVKAGEVEIGAEVVAADAGSDPTPFETGYQVIEYPHVQRRHKLVPATAIVKVIDVALAPSLSVGYIMGVGDQVPSALQQLGARVTMIDSDELAFGDLSRYNTIVTGVRAYERRADLRANNHRLLHYVESGGTVIVQYNRTEFNQAQYGPYRAQVTSERITDENAPVKVLLPTHPIFNYPNKIGELDWSSWVQERGTYFLGQLDPKYVDLVEMSDPFELNPGPKRGALVEARYGKGRWVYVGLVLWRQLPSGTDGAYRLFANLISLGKLPTPSKPLSVER